LGKRLPSEEGEALSSIGYDILGTVAANPHTSDGVVCEQSPSPKWFAVYTVPRHEKRVAEYFELTQIESYLPLYRARRRWRDGSNAELELPLFPGYIFVRIGRHQRVRVLDVPSVLWIVGAGREPLPLPDFEIESLRAGLHLRNSEPHPYLVIGKRVRIKAGALAGMEGVLARKKNNFRVVLTLDHIMQSIAVEVDADELEPILPRYLHPVAS
jgi:transcription antitermination factor NusG